MKAVSDIDFKIISGLERIAQVMRAQAWVKAKDLFLNPMQVQVLLFLLHHRQNKNTITALAKEFCISKASISDTIRALEGKKMVYKNQGIRENKNFTIALTTEGNIAAEHAGLYSQDLRLAISKQTDECKNNFFLVLGELLYDLHKSGIGPVQRICQSCKFHEKREGQHYCSLLEKTLRTDQLQIDCNDHII